MAAAVHRLVALLRSIFSRSLLRTSLELSLKPWADLQGMDVYSTMLWHLKRESELVPLALEAMDQFDRLCHALSSWYLK